MAGHIISKASLLLILLVVAVGCDPTPPPPPSPAVDDAYIDISTQMNPTRVPLGEHIQLTIDAASAIGIQDLVWESMDDGDSFDCGYAVGCSNTWRIEPKEEGTYLYYAWAVDAKGNSAQKVEMEVKVHPADPVSPTPATPPTPPPPPPPTPPGPLDSCGNHACQVSLYETHENCPIDCKELPFTCDNGVCEKGESYLICPQDCKVLYIDCDDGECGVGESHGNCPEDCEILTPNCGDGICDDWENYESCYVDCLDDPWMPGPLCRDCCASDVDCEANQQCQNHFCATIDEV